MSVHHASQLAYFAGIDHGRRFAWQTGDAFVMAHEHDTIRPFVEALRRVRAEKGTTLRLLESGCGEGVNFVHLRQMGLGQEDARIEGVDPCAEAVAVAKAQGLEARVADGLALPYADASFDVVFCRDVLHHLADDGERKKFLSEMTRVAKPGGLVAAIEPNPGNPLILLQSCVLWAERGLRAIRPRRILALKPGAEVIPETPSAAWRVLWHYRSPLRRTPRLAKAILHALRAWEIVSKHFPTVFWSYRIYLWRT